MGGLGGALERRANGVLQVLTETERELCRQLLLRLVQPGEGTEDTRRRARLQELQSAHGSSEALEVLVEKLVNARLIVTEGEKDSEHEHKADIVVEIAHEALIRNWSELRRWIDADRVGLRIQRRLGEAATDWEKGHRDEGVLAPCWPIRTDDAMAGEPSSHGQPMRAWHYKKESNAPVSGVGESPSEPSFSGS
jgi:hypothetical protein